MPAPLALRAFLWLWLIVALLAAHLGWLLRLPLAALPALMLALAALVTLACLRLRPLHAWLEQLDLRALVALHATRLASAYFFALEDRGFLPSTFALPAAWAELVLAGAALVLVLLPLPDRLRHHAFVIWNFAGLFHLLIATASAIRLGLADPAPLRYFAVLPLSLQPTFLLPLLLATHVLLYRRLRAAEAAASGE